jgi:hypothetical protein
MTLCLLGTTFGSLLLQSQLNSGGLTNGQQTQIAVQASNIPANAENGLVSILVPLAFFATVVVIFWLVIRQKQARIQTRVDFQKQLLDKFNSGQEFGEFLESKAGQQFLLELRSQSMRPRDRILTAMQNGIVLAVLGLGMLGLSLARRGFLVPAVLALALGVGFLISTVVASRLSRKWDQNQESHYENAPGS